MIIETIQEDMRSLVSLSGRECAMRYVTWRTGVLLRVRGGGNQIGIFRSCKTWTKTAGAGLSV